MLSLGPLLSDLSAESGQPVAGRLWPAVLVAFLALAAVALFFSLRGTVGKKKDGGEEEHDSRSGTNSPPSGDET